MPVYNGIIFTVQNNSDQSAKIIWDKSYFITPDGNSYKALNTDILKEQKEVLYKAQYISTIPSKSRFTRFTTSVLNSHTFTSETVSAFYTNFQNIQFVNTSYIKEKFFTYDPYWQPSITTDFGEAINFESDIHSLSKDNKSKLLKMLAPIVNKVGKNNMLGLGLVIEHQGIEKEYRFDVKVTSVDTVREVFIPKGQGKYDSIYFIDYSYDLSTSTWKDVGIELKQQDSESH